MGVRLFLYTGSLIRSFMRLFNQPRGAVIGEKIQELLNETGENRFDTFYMMVAYAKKSGVIRLKPYIEFFRQNGGRVRAIVGIDQKNTSIQALSLLLQLCDQITIYHSESLTQTFHPKTYAFEKERNKAIFILGSSNLTSGGLHTNYEFNFLTDYDLTQTEDFNEFLEFKNSFEQYVIHPDCAKPLTQELLERLNQGGYLSDEEVEIRRLFSNSGGTTTPRERIFGRETFRPPPVITVQQSEEQNNEVTGINPINEGFWKRLSNNDVSLTSSPGQIQIPIGNLDLFPPFTDWEIGSQDARQSENYFNVIFISITVERTRVNRARAIIYVPSPNHPRPNQELRFTFRSREILTQLQANDILEFRRTDNPDVWFIIRHIKSTMREHQSYTGRFGVIENRRVADINDFI